MASNPVLTITEDKSLHINPYFLKIITIIDKLAKGSILPRLQGNCLAAAEIIHTMCNEVGIKSKIIECQAAIETTGPRSHVAFIGYDNLSYPGEIDTHVVVVTETEPPLLIDISIPHHLSPTHPYVVEKLNSLDPNTISEFTFEDIKIKYTNKKTSKIPGLHQRNLLADIGLFKKLEKSTDYLKLMVFVAIALGSINFLANAILIVLKTIHP